MQRRRGDHGIPTNSKPNKNAMNHRLAAFLLFVSASAPAAAQSPWYATLSAGQSKTDTGFIPGELPVPITPEGARVSAEETDSAFRVGLGYRFTRHLAVEATYADYGRSRVDSSFVVMRGVAAKVLLQDGTLAVDRRVQGYGADLVASFPVSERFSVLARAGIAVVEVKADARTSITPSLANPFWSDGGSGTTRSGKTTDTVGRFGVGVEWAFAPQLAARVEWERLASVGESFRDGSSSPTGEAETDFWSVGLAWRF